MITPKDLKSICESFEKHVSECYLCSISADHVRIGSINRVELSFADFEEPKLCPVGKGLLLDIFN